MANTIKYGLKNVYVSSVTIAQGGAVTFGAPSALPGAVSLSISQDGGESVFYADNTKYYVAYSNNGYTGTLEVAELPQSFYVDYLGATVDTKGNVTERSSDQAKFFALLFQFEGDDKATKHILYYCKASRPNIEGETTGDTIEPKTLSLEFSALPLPSSGIIKSQSGTASTNYSTWFTTAPTVPTFSA